MQENIPPKVTAALKRAAQKLIYLRFLCSNAIALIPGRGKKNRKKKEKEKCLRWSLILDETGKALFFFFSEALRWGLAGTVWPGMWIYNLLLLGYYAGQCSYFSAPDPKALGPSNSVFETSLGIQEFRG